MTSSKGLAWLFVRQTHDGRYYSSCPGGSRGCACQAGRGARCDLGRSIVHYKWRYFGGDKAAATGFDVSMACFHTSIEAPGGLRCRRAPGCGRTRLLRNRDTHGIPLAPMPLSLLVRRVPLLFLQGMMFCRLLFFFFLASTSLSYLLRAARSNFSTVDILRERNDGCTCQNPYRGEWVILKRLQNFPAGVRAGVSKFRGQMLFRRTVVVEGKGCWAGGIGVSTRY